MDTIKGFACILVVLIHYNWGDDISLILKTIGRFAVPYFFFISGYYLPNRECRITRETVGRKIKHILVLAGKSAVFYAVFCVCWNLLMDSSWNLWTFIRTEIDYASVLKFFVTCDPFVYAHFWYLMASVGCYLVVYLLTDRPGKNGYFAMFVVLLCGYSLLVEFNELVGWKNYHPITEDATLVLSNIFVFRAMPFFLFGIFLRKQETSGGSKAAFYLLLAVVAAGCILAVAEEKRYGTILMYVGNHLMVIALSLISVWYPEKKIGIMEYVGSKLSMYIYIYHIAVGKTLDVIAAKFQLWNFGWYKPLRPVIVLAGSFVAAQLIVLVSEKRRARRSQ